MDKIVLLNANKTKTDKVILTYGYQDPKERYLKGFQICTQWLDDSKIYDNFNDSDFGAIYDAEFGYVDTYNGNAKRVIKTLSTESGEVLFEAK